LRVIKKKKKRLRIMPEAFKDNAGVGFRVQGLGFRVQGVDFGGWGLGLKVEGAGCRVRSLGLMV